MSRICKVEIFRPKLLLHEPFRISLGEINEVENVVVRLVDDLGNEGWGEAAPHAQILSSTAETTLAALSWIAPHLLGKEVQRIGQVVSEIETILSGNAAAKAAIDMALYDLLGRCIGVPVWQILGGGQPQGLPTAYSLGIDEPDKVVAKGRRAVESGIRILKVKVGVDSQRDLETVKMLRKEIAEDVMLIVDANQGWSRQEAVKVLNQMTAFNVSFAEQPLAAEDVEGMAWVRSRTYIPIIADESVHSPTDMIRVAREGAADYVNVKLMKSGGLWHGQQIARIAEACWIPCMIGAMTETNLAITAAVHLGIAHKNIQFADLEVGTREELCIFRKGGVVLAGGALCLDEPEAPGLGLGDPDYGRLGSPVLIFRP